MNGAPHSAGRLLFCILLLIAYLVVCPSLSSAQLPEAGELLGRSREASKLRSHCILSFDKKTKQYECIEPTIAIVRDASQWNLSFVSAATLSAGEPQYLSFPPNSNLCAGFSFVMTPGIRGPLRLRVVFVMEAAQASGVTWGIVWCRYPRGSATCGLSILGYNAVTTVTPAGTARADAEISTAVDWEPGDAVVGRVCRLGADAADQHTAIARMQFGVFELTADPSLE